MSGNADIIFMATSRSGLGHIRRTASIALAAKAQQPDVRIALVTNAPVAGLPEGDQMAFDRTVTADRGDMAKAAHAFHPKIIAADTMAPEGICRLPAARVLILRETPQDRLERLALPPGETWDLVLIPNPKSHWMPPLGGRFAKRAVAAGWIYRRAERKAAAARETPLLLAAAGGGGTDETALALAGQVSAIIRLCRLYCPRPFEAVQALGPRAPVQARITGVDRVIDPGGDLNQCFADADAVISTAGYNSVLELAIASTPALLIPISRTLDDQAARAAQWGPRLGAAYGEGGFDAAARFLAGVLAAQSRRLPSDIGPSGADEAARLLLEMLR